MNREKYIRKIRKSFLLVSCLLLFTGNKTIAYATEENTSFTEEIVAAESSEWEITEPEIYGIGSVSKVFGAAAVMRLVDEGKIELDMPVTEYIPEFEMADERYRQITVRMLLNHSSGIMGTTTTSCFVMGKSREDYHRILLDTLKEQKLKADPGEYSVYCNDGFTLAEIVVERVSGMGFEEFVKKEFIIPLGMQHTFMPTSATGEENFAPIYYGKRQLTWENVQSLASGGIYGTAEDLCRFAQIFMKDGEKILSEESVDAMVYPEYKNNKIGQYEGKSSFGYGLGWDSVDAYPYSAYGIQALLKGGDTGNYGTGLTVLPEQNLSVSVTAAGGSSEYCQLMAQEIVMEVLKENGLLEEAQIQEQQEETATLVLLEDAAREIPEEMKKYAGIYASSQIWNVEFTEDDRLLLTSLEEGDDMIQEYIYTGDGNFVSTKGKYVFITGMAQAAGGRGGITEFHFSEEPNGKVYMVGTTYVTVAGETKNAVTMPFAEKIEENPLSESVNRAWEARNGKKYYLVSEACNSMYYLTLSNIKIGQLSALQGYTRATSNVKNCRITDENNAVCELDIPIMLGRDLKDYRFRQDDGIEYMELGGMTFIKEDAMQSSEILKADVQMGTMGQWYEIAEADAGSEIEIEVPAGGAYYVYDKDDKCIAGSLLQGENPTVILPTEGKLLLVGEKGSRFGINR